MSRTALPEAAAGGLKPPSDATTEGATSPWPLAGVFVSTSSNFTMGINLGVLNPGISSPKIGAAINTTPHFEINDLKLRGMRQSWSHHLARVCLEDTWTLVSFTTVVMWD